MDNVHRFPHRVEIEEQAGDWLARLDGDRPLSQQEMAELKAWVDRSPIHREELHKLARFWQQANLLTELSIPLSHSRSSNPEQQERGPGRNLGTHTRTHTRTWELGWRGAGAVATVVLVSLFIGMSSWFADRRGYSRPQVAGNGVYETRIGEQNSITLRDGSVIQLNTNSRVQVNYSTGRRGIVLMQGEAHFDVSKDAKRPFEVAAGLGLVRAVGTAFAVRYRPQATIESPQSEKEVLQVTVTEGQVALEAMEARQQTSTEKSATGAGSNQSNPSTGSAKAQLVPVARGSLSAGQSVAFDPQASEPIDESIHILGEVALQKALAWRDGLLLFTGEPLSEVVNEMRRYTDSHIEIVDPDIAKLSIGGQFKVGEADAMLQALAVSFDIEVRHVSSNHIQLAKKP